MTGVGTGLNREVDWDVEREKYGPVTESYSLLVYWYALEVYWQLFQRYF